jgi:hypothetical protein
VHIHIHITQKASWKATFMDIDMELHRDIFQERGHGNRQVKHQTQLCIRFNVTDVTNVLVQRKHKILIWYLFHSASYIDS